MAGRWVKLLLAFVSTVIPGFIGTDRIENTSPNSTSIVASCIYRHGPRREHRSPVTPSYVLRSFCLATGVFAEPFPSNGCLVSGGFTVLALSKYTTIIRINSACLVTMEHSEVEVKLHLLNFGTKLR
jgi:hypothetical protein